jgi:hypothetical protein
MANTTHRRMSGLGVVYRADGRRVNPLSVSLRNYHPRGDGVTGVVSGIAVLVNTRLVPHTIHYGSALPPLRA